MNCTRAAATYKEKPTPHITRAIVKILPAGPTAYGDSPYQPLSAFAGNPMLIGLHPLLRMGLLHADVMVLRLLAEDGFSLRQSLVPVLDLMTQDRLPPSWRL